MQRRSLLKTALAAATLTSLLATTALAENTVLKIGFVGVTSGPAASWGYLEPTFDGNPRGVDQRNWRL